MTKKNETFNEYLINEYLISRVQRSIAKHTKTNKGKNKKTKKGADNDSFSRRPTSTSASICAEAQTDGDEHI